MVLDDPANGSYGMVAVVAADAGVGSVRLELSGAKSVTATDNAAPFSLHGETDGAVAGEGLPVGAYTLKATAYAEADGGTPLGTLEVSFTVAASEPGVDPDALTASFVAVPAAHGGPGSEAFVFELAFSEEPELSYKVLRDVSLAATRGAVRKAQRLERPFNIRWRITVEPSGWDDVTVTLAGGRACTASGAICTEGGKVLANTATATVPGPLALTVADARVAEGADAELAFTVSLNRAASAKVTVLDDALDDGEETLTLALSNASGARIRDAEATGTIVNSDPLPRAWLARFGRTAAGHVLDAVGERLAAPSGG